MPQPLVELVPTGENAAHHPSLRSVWLATVRIGAPRSALRARAAADDSYRSSPNYPDLIDRPLAITLRQDADGAVLVSVTEDVAVATGLSGSSASGSLPAAPLLTARVAFDAAVQLTRYDAYGPLLHEAENTALQDQLIANPRWIDSDADVWLMQRGARSTFGTTFEAAPQARQQVEAQLGAARTPAPAVFRWYQEGNEAARVFRSRPAWIAEATMRAQDGTARVYALEYEPFGGRLIAVTERGTR